MPEFRGHHTTRFAVVLGWQDFETPLSFPHASARVQWTGWTLRTKRTETTPPPIAPTPPETVLRQ